MDTAHIAEFQDGRRRWLDGIASRILDSKTSADLTSNDASLTEVEQALLVTHVGLSHLHGFDDSESGVQAFLSDLQVEGLISRNWRKGRFDVRLASNAELLWSCLVQLGRSTGTVRQTLLDAVCSSRLGLQREGVTAYFLQDNKADAALYELLGNDPVVPADLSALGSFDLDCEGSHLAIVRGLFEREGLETLKLLSGLELMACIPDNDRTSRNDEALKAARRLQDYSMSGPGGWPGGTHPDVPSWVRDAVIVSGERLMDAGVGFVPSLIFVAESDDAFKGMVRWTYNSEPLAARVSSDILRLGIDLLSPSTEDPFRAEWAFQLRDDMARTRLEAALAIGLFRLDIYNINTQNRLEYQFSFGCRLSPATIDACHSYLEQRGSGAEVLRRFEPMVSGRWLETFSRVEQGAFNSLAQGMSAAPGSDLESAFRHYLTVVDGITTPAASEPSNIHLKRYENAREELHTAIASSERKTTETIDLADLGPGRAYAQFVYTEDPAPALTAHVAYLDTAGEVVVELFDFEDSADPSWTIENQSAGLANGLRSLRALVEKGIDKVVVNAHSVTYNLPYHEALLRIGFTEVSYTHRAATLARVERPPMPGVCIAGFAGEGTKFLEAVTREMEFASELYNAKISNMRLAKLPATVHLTGHGHSGISSYNFAIAIYGDAPPLSSSRILLEVDASATELVYLSACSTGRGHYPALHVADAIPLDVAFIERGARVALSTSDVVSDSVSCFFACVFHEARLGGETIWDAYALAREATRTQTAPDHPLLHEMLERIWPTWNQDLLRASAAYPDDWQLFRLSGRHWV